MPAYLLLLHECPADSAALSAAELGDIIRAHQAWADRLAAAGQLLGGEKLTDDGGRQLRLDGRQPVASDGPYAEAHDVIGGFYMLKAASLAEAEDIAAACPHRRAGQWIELREIEAIERGQ
ncbi:MAG: transcription initiation protein [Roseateles depolymerans]|uniref:Transcription initiation protein n=1 Tax=Roseateles depolymerans TaxID=76731 RepID=A0A2W5DK94_9BURK|nr:MAG: transcription initiation protein [Roseateles depolymerans]